MTASKQKGFFSKAWAWLKPRLKSRNFVTTTVSVILGTIQTVLYFDPQVLAEAANQVNQASVAIKTGGAIGAAVALGNLINWLSHLKWK